MRGTPLATAISLALAVGLLAVVAVMPSLAVNPIEVQPLTIRSAFTDDTEVKVKVKVDGLATDVTDIGDPTYTQTAMFTVQPGAMFPWHTHPGTVVVNVTSGELVYVPADECQERHYPAGTAFVDPGHGHVHTAYNPGSVPAVLVATFYGLPESGPLSTPVTPPADCVVTP
jgi:quercetin dioxygenase-like cupin family protein